MSYEKLTVILKSVLVLVLLCLVILLFCQLMLPGEGAAPGYAGATLV